MYKELFLDSDRSNTSAGKITTPDYLKEFYTLMMMLQGIRRLHKCKEYFPGSILVFRTQNTDQKEGRWDFIDQHNTLFIGVRIGEIGITCLLQDGASVKQACQNLYRFKRHKLSPIQFREICANVYYMGVLFNRIPKYVTYPTKQYFVTIQAPLQGLSNKPLFDPWDNRDYAYILSQFVSIPFESCFHDGKCMTWLPQKQNKQNRKME